MRMLGMHGAAFANYAVDDCDFLFTLGARFDDRVAGNPPRFAPNAKCIAQIDIDASEINKVKPVHWHHVGLLPEALRTLRNYARRVEFPPRLVGVARALRRLCASKYAMNYDRDSELIQPYHVIEEINKLTRGEAIISTGVGQHQMWAAQYFDFAEPRLWLTSGSMGTMGFGLPAAIGAQFARPDRLVIDVDGDASIRMNIGETGDRHHLRSAGEGRGAQQLRRRHGEAMAEAVLQGPPVRQRQIAAQEGFHQGRAGGRFPVRRATGTQGRRGARGARVHRVQGRRIPRSDDRSRCRRVPMVGPGQAYDEMITGDFIPSRTKTTEISSPDASEMF